LAFEANFVVRNALGGEQEVGIEVVLKVSVVVIENGDDLFMVY